MNCNQASTITGGLSHPSKMPGRAFGFSATKCITGSRLRRVPGSVCSGCYAMKGMYVFPTVKRAHDRRFRALSLALKSTRHRTRWIQAAVTLISKQQWFRWHDSGDLQSVDHLRLIADVCRATPDTRHWLPTREYHMVSQYLATGEHIPSNLTIRLSAHMRNQTLTDAGILPGTTASAVYDKLDTAPGHQCPARTQGNICGDCRACWDTNTKHVAYATH